jgi:hypothetical protein
MRDDRPAAESTFHLLERARAGDERPLVQHLKVVAAVAGTHRMPDSLGHLLVLERIGKGTFGEVYRAWDSRLDREVALSCCPQTIPPIIARTPPSFTKADCSPASATTTSSRSMALRACTQRWVPDCISARLGNVDRRFRAGARLTRQLHRRSAARPPTPRRPLPTFHPGTSAIVREGGLLDRTVLYCHALAFDADLTAGRVLRVVRLSPCILHWRSSLRYRSDTGGGRPR